MNEQQNTTQQVVENQNGVEVDAQQPQQQEEKTFTYTQSELDKMFETRLARQEKRLNAEFERKMQELDEASKLARMSEEERREHDYNKKLADLEAREKALADKENAYNRQNYLNEITAQLQAKGLPTDMAELLVSLPAEEVSAKIASMEKSFNTQVNNSIQDKIKSSANTPTVPQEQNRLLTLEEIKAMSTNEYLANRELVEKSLKALKK